MHVDRGDGGEQAYGERGDEEMAREGWDGRKGASGPDDEQPPTN